MFTAVLVNLYLVLTPRLPFLVIAWQIPKKSRISRWFHRRYTVDLPPSGSSPSDSCPPAGDLFFHLRAHQVAGLTALPAILWYKIFLSEGSLQCCLCASLSKKKIKKSANNWLGTHILLPPLAMWLSILQGSKECTTAFIRKIFDVALGTYFPNNHRRNFLWRSINPSSSPWSF